MAQVLVVDDDDLFRETLCVIIESSGYVCEPVSRVSEALVVLGSRSVDLVLSDYDMPMENGLSLIKKMKTQPRLERIPVILMTGIPDPALIALGRKVGAFATLLKPFGSNLLIEVMAKALECLPEKGSDLNGKK